MELFFDLIIIIVNGVYGCWCDGEWGEVIWYVEFVVVVYFEFICIDGVLKVFRYLGFINIFKCMRVLFVCVCMYFMIGFGVCKGWKRVLELLELY